MYNRFRELPHNYISFQKIDRKGRRYTYQKKPINTVYSYVLLPKCLVIFHWDILSQMVTFLVHRLINEQNKKAVKSAASAASE